MKKETLNKSIDSYEISIGIYIFIFSIVIIYVINTIFGFYNNYKQILDNLYNYSYIISLIQLNIKYIFGIIFLYIVFLGYIKEKKGIIFGNISEGNINSKYGNIFLLLNRSISFLSIFYLYFLYETKNIFELLVIFIISVLTLLTLHIIKKYIEVRENYNSLEQIRKIDLNNNKKENIFDYLILKFFTSTYNDYLIGITFTLAFIIIPLGIKLNYNLITIVILHFNFIFIFIALNLLSHNFPSKVKLKFNNQIKEGFLLENTKNRIILMTKKENYILNPSKIEYIKTKKK